MTVYIKHVFILAFLSLLMSNSSPADGENANQDVLPFCGVHLRLGKTDVEYSLKRYQLPATRAPRSLYYIKAWEREYVCLIDMDEKIIEIGSLTDSVKTFYKASDADDACRYLYKQMYTSLGVIGVVWYDNYYCKQANLQKLPGPLNEELSIFQGGKWKEDALPDNGLRVLFEEDVSIIYTNFKIGDAPSKEELQKTLSGLRLVESLTPPRPPGFFWK